MCLYSHLINASPFSCAAIHFDYDIRLDDIGLTGSEKLAVEVYYKDMWHGVELLSNTGSFEWEHHHHVFPDAGGGIFKIRFRAFGENSTAIASWYLDNICVTPVCYPPLAPSTTGHYLINLRIRIPDTLNEVRTHSCSPEHITQELSGYKVCRSSDGGFAYTLLTPDPIPDTSYLDSDPPLGSPALYYYMTAIYDNAVCESIPSDTVEVLVTSTYEPSYPVISVFPNPASGLLQVTSDQPLVGFGLVDFIGREVIVMKGIPDQHYTMDVSDLSPGIYIMRIHTVSGYSCFRVAIAR